MDNLDDTDGLERLSRDLNKHILFAAASVLILVTGLGIGIGLIVYLGLRMLYG